MDEFISGHTLTIERAAADISDIRRRWYSEGDEAKWSRITAISQVAFLNEHQEHDHQDDEQTRDVA